MNFVKLNDQELMDINGGSIAFFYFVCAVITAFVGGYGIGKDRREKPKEKKAAA
ncbi:class IIb bacteriocin, lactobin A/cerein 7B family [Crassaminicella profunda]|uniref:class IIb bacteriocin, lactobin A/cerein 7B family n=1 Tax=Crassaminicella profunda TaxID=1286698 RepID=UPI001CA748C7|nr:class IIb bacteriocin, lactobin A/cerein 7B family [Crassaminicella profunda]QZY54912.1 class IIb bacteriocin, lactobin A/cerein 7B family [Crassaminicella profunda]